MARRKRRTRSRVVRRRGRRVSPGERTARSAVGTTVTLATLPKMLSVLGA